MKNKFIDDILAANWQEVKATLQDYDIDFNSEKNPILHYAIFKEAPKEIIEIILKKGAEVNFVTNECDIVEICGKTPLKIAREIDPEDSRGIADLLLDKGAIDTYTHDLSPKKGEIEPEPIENLDQAASYLYKETKARLKTRKKENAKIYADILYSDAFAHMSLDEFLKSKEREGQEEIYNSFIRRFKGMLLEGIKDLRSVKHEDSTFVTGLKLSSNLLKFIPFAGGGLSLVASAGATIYGNIQSKRAYREFLDRVSSLGDEIIEDFVYRSTLYYREDILHINVDRTFVEKAEGFFSSFTDPRNPNLSERLWSKIKTKYIEGDTGSGEKIFTPKHWDDIIEVCSGKFLSLLMDQTKIIDVNFGKLAAEKVIPIPLEKLQDQGVIVDGSNSHANIYDMGVFAQLAYSSDATIGRLLKKWNFDAFHIYRDSNLKGFITQDSNRIIVSFRGTYQEVNWLKNVDIRAQKSVKYKHESGTLEITLHKGFYTAFKNIWDGDKKTPGLKDKFKQYLEKNPRAKIYITGHSLGGAIASVAACEILGGELEVANPAPQDVVLYTYAQPRWCHKKSVDAARKLLKHYHRVVAHLDVVPYVPTKALGYDHVVDMHFLYKGETITISDPKDIKEDLWDNWVNLALKVDKHFMINYLESMRNIMLREDQAAKAASRGKINQGVLDAPKEDEKDRGRDKDKENSIDGRKEGVKDSKTTSSSEEGRMWTDLHDAADEGNLEKARSILESAKKKISIDQRDEEGDTPLHRAMNHNKPNLVTYLTEQGANKEIKNNNGDTPLLEGMRRRSKEALKTLQEVRTDYLSQEELLLYGFLSAKEDIIRQALQALLKINRYRYCLKSL